MSTIKDYIYYTSTSEGISLPHCVDTFIQDSVAGVQYWRKHKHHKCYRCNKYGHLAGDCDRICPLCANLHTSSICVNTLYTLLRKIYEKTCVIARREHQINIVRASESLIKSSLEEYTNNLKAIKKAHTGEYKLLNVEQFTIKAESQLTTQHCASIYVQGTGKSTSGWSFTGLFRTNKQYFIRPVKVVSFYSKNQHALQRYNTALKDYNNYRMNQYKADKIAKQLAQLQDEMNKKNGLARISLDDQIKALKKQKVEYNIETAKRKLDRVINLRKAVNAGEVVISVSSLPIKDANYDDGKSKIKHLKARAEKQIALYQKQFDKSIAAQFDKFVNQMKIANDLDKMIAKKEQKLENLSQETEDIIQRATQKASKIKDKAFAKKDAMYQKFKEINKKIDSKRVAFGESKNNYIVLLDALKKCKDVSANNNTINEILKDIKFEAQQMYNQKPHKYENQVSQARTKRLSQCLKKKKKTHKVDDKVDYFKVAFEEPVDYDSARNYVKDAGFPKYAE